MIEILQKAGLLMLLVSEPSRGLAIAGGQRGGGAMD